MTSRSSYDSLYSTESADCWSFASSCRSLSSSNWEYARWSLNYWRLFWSVKNLARYSSDIKVVSMGYNIRRFFFFKGKLLFCNLDVVFSLFYIFLVYVFTHYLLSRILVELILLSKLFSNFNFWILILLSWWRCLPFLISLPYCTGDYCCRAAATIAIDIFIILNNSINWKLQLIKLIQIF